MPISSNYHENMVSSLIWSKGRLSYLAEALAAGVSNEHSAHSPKFEPETYRLRRDIDRSEQRAERLESVRTYLQTNRVIHERITSLTSSIRKRSLQSIAVDGSDGSIVRSLSSFVSELSNIANTSIGRRYALSADRADEPPVPVVGGERMNDIEDRFRNDFAAFFGVESQSVDASRVTASTTMEFLEFLERNSFSPENWKSLWFKESEASLVDNEASTVTFDPASKSLSHLRSLTALSMFARSLSHLELDDDAIHALSAYAGSIAGIAEIASVDRAANAAISLSYVEREILRNDEDTVRFSQRLSNRENSDQFSIANEISELRSRLEASSVVVAKMSEFYLAKYI